MHKHKIYLGLAVCIIWGACISCQPSLNTNKGDIPYQQSLQKMLKSLDREDRTNLLACIDYLSFRENKFMHIDKMYENAAKFRALQKLHRMTAPEVIELTQKLRLIDEKNALEKKIENLRNEIERISTLVENYEKQRQVALTSQKEIAEAFPVLESHLDIEGPEHAFQKQVRISLKAENRCKHPVYAIRLRTLLDDIAAVPSLNHQEEVLAIPSGLQPGETWTTCLTKNLPRQEAEFLQHEGFTCQVLQLLDDKKSTIVERQEFSHDDNLALKECRERLDSIHAQIESLKTKLDALRTTAARMQG